MGRVVFAGGDQGIDGLDVEVTDVFPIPDNDLGKTKTVNGDFELSYEPDDYGRWEQNRSPNIRVVIYGPVKRVLYDETFEAVLDTVLDLGTIEIHKNNIGEQDPANDPASKAWLVTHATLNPKTGEAINLSEGNAFEALIDGTALFPRVTDVVNIAQFSVNFMNLNFRIAKDVEALDKKDFLITKFKSSFTPQAPALGQPVTGDGDSLQELLKKKAASGLPVRVVVSDIAMSNSDSVEQVKKFFGPPSLVQTRIAKYGISVLHARAVVVDGNTALLVGSSIDQNYFNSTEHFIRDARHRGSLLHDVSAHVSGPAVSQIDETFVTVWNQADTKATPITPKGRTPGTGSVAMQILRTLPGQKFRSPFAGALSIEHGETGILEAYQRAIARAENFIYIEDQYFTNNAIVEALIIRMEQVKTLQLIMVLNIKPDVTGYPRKQIKLIKEIQNRITNHQERFRVFTLWSTQFSDDPNRIHKRFEIMPIYVHSKVAIIDDKWATVGTANLDGSGLNFIEMSDVVKAVLSIDLDKLKLFLKAVALLVLATAAAIIFWAFLQILVSQAVATLITKGVITAAAAALLVKKLVAIDEPNSIGTLGEEAIRSIHAATQHANPLQELQPSRHVEMNLVMYNGVAGQPSTNAIKDLREALWKEHLGLVGPFPAEPVEEPTDPPGQPRKGWLKLWQKQANARIANVLTNMRVPPGNTGVIEPAHILEWKAESEPEPYLEAHGVNKHLLTIRNKADDFNYLKGQWEKNKL